MKDDTKPDLLTADLARIQRRIPHRYPCLDFDPVRAIDLGHTAVGLKNVTINEPQFQGHFPVKPIMPGVMIVEAMAQTAAVLIAMTLDLIDRDPLVYFMTMDKFRFRQMVVPGDQLELHVEVMRGRGKLWKLKGVGKVGGKVVTEGEFAAMIDLPEL
jgi:3-hydroxyacyl-[acyl-carrier-protein] dehydratase